MLLTVISDTHYKHHQLTNYLIGGDIIIHCGDLSGYGYSYEIIDFLEWYNRLPYNHKIFIAGNHDGFFQDYPTKAKELLKDFPDIDYLENDLCLVGDDYESSIKVWGSPYQPEFNNWYFNLPRGGNELKENWDLIPINTDILVTHGPPQTILDTSGPPWNNPLLGCEHLLNRIQEVKPKIHVFGHIHNQGYRFVDGTHFINCSVLNEQYNYHGNIINFHWDKDKNLINFL